MITALIIVFLVKFQSTLPRRERQSLEIYLILLCNFNPHSHEGSDKDHHNDLQSVVDFNPHSHEGSDSHTIQSAIIVTYFNPHSHEGSDFLFYQSSHFYMISIHTPTKGATAILTNNFLIFCSISLINFILYLQIIQILFIFRYKFIFYFIF